MGLFKKKKEEFKKIENTDVEANDSKEFNEFPEEDYDTADLPETSSQTPQRTPKKLISDEEEIEELKKELVRRERKMEEKKRQEGAESSIRELSLIEAIDIIQANTNRNLELLYYIRKNGV